MGKPLHEVLKIVESDDVDGEVTARQSWKDHFKQHGDLPALPWTYAEYCRSSIAHGFIPMPLENYEQLMDQGPHTE